ncbi:MAG TPA: FeoA family protein [Armatimonadota bacterium]|nr:FeoA family protein [Armatimonadota bacterium]
MTPILPPRSGSGLPLLLAPTDRPVTVHDIRGGSELRTRLAALGVYPGVELTVISASLGGPCIIAVKESRLALDRGMAHRILVG